MCTTWRAPGSVFSCHSMTVLPNWCETTYSAHTSNAEPCRSVPSLGMLSTAVWWTLVWWTLWCGVCRTSLESTGQTCPFSVRVAQPLAHQLVCPLLSMLAPHNLQVCSLKLWHCGHRRIATWAFITLTCKGASLQNLSQLSHKNLFAQPFVLNGYFNRTRSWYQVFTVPVSRMSIFQSSPKPIQK
jgi:hypothetical protein